MGVFQTKTFRRTPTASSSLGERIGAAYRSRLSRHPFLLFGFPFVMIIVAGSFALTPATALRYERYDRKVQQLDRDEAMDLGLKGPDGEEGIKRNPRRRIVGDERDEYYVSLTASQYSAQAMSLTRSEEAYGQGSRQLGAEASTKIQRRTGWKTIIIKVHPISVKCGL